MQPFSPPRKTKSWPETVLFFETLVERWPHYQPLLKLVRQLATSRYAETLFPATAMARLILAQGSALSPGTDRIFLDYHPEQDSFALEAPEPSPFITSLPAGNAAAGLLEILAGRHWIELDPPPTEG